MTEIVETNHVDKDEPNSNGYESGFISKFKIKFSNFAQIITMEPILFLFNFSSYVVWNTSHDFFLNRACLVNFEYSELICSNLSHYDDQRNAVQSMVSSFLTQRSILEAVLKVFAVLALGWWGDKSGWKRPLIFCLLCLALESVVFLICSLVSSWPLQALFASCVFYGLSGGNHGLLLLSFSFMAELSTKGARTVRMGVLEGFFYLGSPVGLALAPSLIRLWSYAGVFAIAVISYAVALLYLLARLPWQTQRITDNELAERGPETTDCLGISVFVDSFKATIRRRPDNARSFILTCVLAMTLGSFTIWGEGNVKYLFAQNVLEWTYTTYSYYSSASSFISVLGTLVFVPLVVRRLSFSDSSIGLFGVASRTVSRIFFACALSADLQWVMYAGCVCDVASCFVPVAIRSLTSKLANEEVGKVYSVMAVAESVLPFAAAPLYNGVYVASLDLYAAAFYLLSIGLNIALAACFLFLYFSLKNRRQE